MISHPVAKSCTKVAHLHRIWLQTHKKVIPVSPRNYHQFQLGQWPIQGSGDATFIFIYSLWFWQTGLVKRRMSIKFFQTNIFSSTIHICILVGNIGKNILKPTNHESWWLSSIQTNFPRKIIKTVKFTANIFHGNIAIVLYFPVFPLSHICLSIYWWFDSLNSPESIHTFGFVG